jgi:hypothetical protein
MRVVKAIGILQRRKEFLDQRISLSDKELHYDKAEAAAILVVTERARMFTEVIEFMKENPTSELAKTLRDRLYAPKEETTEVLIEA